MHRVTLWKNERDQVVQVAVCCLSQGWEPQVEVTEAVGPFDNPDELILQALRRAHALAPLAHQLELFAPAD